MMRNNKRDKVWFGAVVALLGTLTFPTSSFAIPTASPCDALPSHDTLKAALQTVVAMDKEGCGLNMSATVVNRNGVVCAAAFSAKQGPSDDPIAMAYRRTLEDVGASANTGQANDLIAEAYRRTLEDASRSGTSTGDQWPGNQVISAQKANSGNAFSFPELAFSANKGPSDDPIAMAYRRTLEDVGASANTGQANDLIAEAYRRTLEDASASANTGQPNNPMVWKKIEGVNVFGDDVELYATSGTLVGALGVRGDTSCRNRRIASEVGKLLGLNTISDGLAQVTHTAHETSETP